MDTQGYPLRTSRGTRQEKLIGALCGHWKDEGEIQRGLESQNAKGNIMNFEGTARSKNRKDYAN